MILQALNSFYERLEADPDSEIAPFGFSRQKIGFCVILTEEGDFFELQLIGRQDGKRYIPQSLIVPGNGARSGSTPKPFLLSDNPLYLFGIPPKDRGKEWADLRFEAFRELHLQHEEGIKSKEFTAVCNFLRQHQPGALPTADIAELQNNGVFRIRGAHCYIHESPQFLDWYRSTIKPEEEVEAVHTAKCLITGKESPIATTHFPKIKGVRDKPGAPAEKYVVAVDKSFTAAESYGRSSNLNSPVSEQAAFQYCTALNLLLDDRRRRFQIGDATTVFWTEQPTPAENFLGLMIDSQSAEDETQALKVQTALQAIAAGKYPGEFGPPETRFYVLGLSPNAARISVRFWLEGTLDELVQHLRHHYDDLKIVRNLDKDPEFVSPYQILRETVRDAKDLPPLLGGALMRAMLTGQLYPEMLLSSLIRRIRADREVRYIRAAAIKACLNRHFRLQLKRPEQELPMSLDPDRPEPAYQMGRFFAELEKAQEDALPGINDTIKDRYFGAASATPASVFPRLIRLSQHHLGKLEKPKRVFREKRLQEVAVRFDGFPVHLSLRDQGLFAIGYYHQRQNIFSRKSDQSTMSDNQE